MVIEYQLTLRELEMLNSLRILKTKLWKQTFSLGLCVLFGVNPLTFPACAATPVLSHDDVEIDTLTNEILRKEIDLERFYLQYRIDGSKEPKTRRVRFFAMQAASAAVGMASGIWQLKIFGSNVNSPNEVKNSDVRGSYRVGIVAVLLDAGSVSLELGSNTWIAIRNIMKKRSPGYAVKNVIARIEEIDKLREERHKLVDQCKDSQMSGVYHAEGRVLKAFRDWCLSEFAEVYSDIKSLQSSYNVYYVIDLAADCLYLASYITGIQSFNDDRKSWPSVTTGIVGDSLGIASAPASSRSYYAFSKYWRARLQKKFKESLKDSEDDAKAAMDELKKELASNDIATLEGSSCVFNRAAAYALWSARYDKFLDERLDDLRHANKVALQGELTGPLISGGYLAQDVLAAVALKRLGNRPSATNYTNLVGSINSTSASALSLWLTNYWYFDEIRHRHRLKKKGELPEQLMAKRMKTLDELDSMLISSSKPVQVQ